MECVTRGNHNRTAVCGVGSGAPYAAVRRCETDSSWEHLPPHYRHLLSADMRSIWDIRAMLDAKHDEPGNRAEIFHRCYTTFNDMTNTIIGHHSGGVVLQAESSGPIA